MNFRTIGLGLTILGAGCASHPIPPAPKGLLPATAAWQIVLSTSPRQPRQLDPILFTVHMTDLKGKPVAGAAVTVTLVMPTMDMGRNQAALHEASSPPGTYLGTGRFTMPGDWQAAVQGNKGGKRAEKTVSFTVQ